MLEQSLAHRRKCVRKHSKYKNILLKETGLKHSDEPGKHLMLCNAGLVSGIGECDVVQFFSQFGQIESVTMLQGKSYSFVTFTKTADAVTAFESANGKQIFKKMNGPLYLLYTNSVPEIKDSVTVSLPEGLHVINDFISKSEEEHLLKSIDWSDFGSCVGKSVLKNRRVKHYGYEFNYNNNNIDKDKPMSARIPEECHLLFDRLREQGYDNIMSWIPDQLTVNEYQPGHGIPSHVDTHSAFESPIIVASMGSDIIMEFKHSDGRHIPVLLPQRSLLIMDGESRYDWNHGITPRKVDVIQSPESGLITQERGIRTSFTFRKIRFEPCNCKYHVHCDSQQSEKIISASEASRLEAQHVHQVYENISSHFSETRHKPWPNVAEFVNLLEPGAFLVDVGCGNGKYFGFNKHIFEVGCDRSFNLSKECYERGHQVFTCDCLKLPIRSGCVDGVISIAVIHHLSTYERRLSALKEIARILHVDGKALVYVWAKDQKKGERMSSYLKQDRKNRKKCSDDNEQKSDKKDSTVLNSNDEITGSNHVCNEFALPVHKNRTQFEHDDLLVPWKLKTNKEKVFYRYYHIFNEGELESLVSLIADVKIVKSYYDQGNWCVIFEKIK